MSSHIIRSIVLFALLTLSSVRVTAQLVVTSDPLVEDIFREITPPTINTADADAIKEAEAIMRATPKTDFVPGGLMLCTSVAVRLADNLLNACRNGSTKLEGWRVRTVEVSDCHSAVLLTSKDGKRHYYLDAYWNPWGGLGGAVELSEEIKDQKWVPFTDQFTLQMVGVGSWCGLVNAYETFVNYKQNRRVQWPAALYFRPDSGIPIDAKVICAAGTRVATAAATGVCRQADTMSLDVRTVASYDPNDKLGSRGSGTSQFISGEEPLRYSILFENIETATAPAQEVVITDQLDTSKIDLNTLSLGPISFGNKQIVPPPGLTEYTTTVDLRPAKQLLVNVEGRLNKTTGLLTWRFTSIDPVTGQLPNDPLVGFLPPNRVPPEGDGSEMFTVMPKKGLPTGTQIRNQARIIFDTNAPIDTPQWLNTFDNTKPTSNVLPLSPTQSSANFNVQWQGSDVGSGVRNYTIFVSENGGPFTPWLSNTSATSGIFTGQSGKTYDFYSVAQDQTGNREDPPNEADATTQVVTGADLAITQTAAPNPVLNGSNVTYTITVANNGSGAAADVTVTDNLPVSTTFVSCSSTGGGVCGGSGNNRTVTFTSLAVGASATITLVANVNCSVADNTAISNTATVSSSTPDPVTNNNSAMVTTTASNPPPVITDASANPSELWPPNHRMVEVTVNYNVTDNCAPLTCTLNVISNEPINGIGDGDTAPDWEIVDAHHVRLRAERAGNGSGRIYTIIITCSDGAGNSLSRSVTVRVPNNQGQN